MHPHIPLGQPVNPRLCLIGIRILVDVHDALVVYSPQADC